MCRLQPASLASTGLPLPACAFKGLAGSAHRSAKLCFLTQRLWSYCSTSGIAKWWDVILSISAALENSVGHFWKVSLTMSSKLMDTEKSSDDITLQSFSFLTPSTFVVFFHHPHLLALHFLSCSKTCLHLSPLLLQFANPWAEVINNCPTITMLGPYCCRLSCVPDCQSSVRLMTAVILLLESGRRNK